jgi:hypothetical protein
VAHGSLVVSHIDWHCEKTVAIVITRRKSLFGDSKSLTLANVSSEEGVGQPQAWRFQQVAVSSRHA